MWTYLFGPIFALLPYRWREDHLRGIPIDWPRATIISGISETGVALAALVAWYSMFVTRLAPIIDPYIGGSPYVGYVGLFSLMMHPLTWLICYLGVEGAVRAAGALATEQTLGSLPFVTIYRTVRWAKTGDWRVQPVLVGDEVTRGEGSWDLKIASRKPKAHWKYPLAIRYRGEFFQVQGEEHVTAVSGRPHVYLLRRLPANEIIRGLEDYDPLAAFVEDNPPGFVATVFGELRKKFAK